MPPFSVLLEPNADCLKKRPILFNFPYLHKEMIHEEVPQTIQPEDTPASFAKLALFGVQASRAACVTKHPERNLSNIIIRWFFESKNADVFLLKTTNFKSEKVMEDSGVIYIFHIGSYQAAAPRSFLHLPLPIERPGCRDV